MMIGHAPAGWLLARTLAGARLPRGWMLASLLGSLAPDLDMLWFFASGGQTHHHAYPSHFPLLWLAGVVLSLGVGHRAMVLFALSGLLHQLLDSIVGDIAWGAPFDMQRRSLLVVTDRFDPWWLNFVVHPSFLLEIALIVATYVRWRADQRAGSSQR